MFTQPSFSLSSLHNTVKNSGCGGGIASYCVMSGSSWLKEVSSYAISEDCYVLSMYLTPAPTCTCGLKIF